MAPLFCSLGLHRPEPEPVWNRGFWFSRCGRCGADLIRTAAGGLHVPEGKKVVWKPRRPSGRRDRDGG